MGTIVNTQPPRRGGRPAAVSRGAGVFETFYAKYTMGATYATGGDVVTKPTVPDNLALWAVEVISHDAGAGIDIVWNHSTSAPKLLAYDEDNTSGIAAEIANASAALAAVVVYLRFIYTTGI